MDKFWIESFKLLTSACLLPSIFEQLTTSDVPFPWIRGFLSGWSFACTRAVCGRISITFAIFRQKSGRGFLRFSLSLALFPPFPVFRLYLFSTFPSSAVKKNKSLCRGESYETVLSYATCIILPFFYWNTWNIYTRYFVLFTEYCTENHISIESFSLIKCMKLVMKDERIRGMIWRYAIINPNNNYSARWAVSLNINYRISFESSRQAEQDHAISRDQRYRRFSYQTRRLQRCSLRLPTRSKSTQTGHLYTTAQAGTDPRHFRM